MKVSLKWLQEYVDITVPQAELADRLTMAGSEVTGVRTIGGGWENIVVGQIIAVDPHPDADRLRLVTVDMGTEQRTVVCGAPNLELGDKIALAHTGAQLVDPHSGKVFRLKPAKIRGVESRGMVCSEKELGVSDNHEGIMVLPAEAPVGAPLADYIGDTVFDLDVTTNRPDCLSVIGIARETAALTNQSVHLPEIEFEEAASPIDGQISIEISSPELCSRYCASLIVGIEVKASPSWMQQRLIACGMRPINNIVDVTNYVMLEYGQPLHAFDYHRIRGRKIIVRQATGGETVVTLDGIKRELSASMLVIADDEGAVAIAGVMGGADSEVIEQTTSILLEAANFDPASVHYTGDALRLPSEARSRFERGISSELALPALERATQLIVQLAGGEAAKGVVDLYPGQKSRESILLSADKVKRVLGVEFGIEQVVKVLSSLGFDCQITDAAAEVRVTAPYWRTDIRQAVDLVEEIARIIGYDKIPVAMLGQPLPRQNPEPILGLKQEVRRAMAGSGFDEIITFSLTGLEVLNKLSPEPHSPVPALLRVVNPMTADQEYLRPNLRAGLLTALAANRRHEDGGIRLFELGKVYLPRKNDLPDESEVVCGVLAGLRLEKSWQGNDELLDFFDAKGVVEGLCHRLSLEVSFEKSEDESLSSSRQAAVVIAGNRLGVVGEVHPEVSAGFGITEPVFLLEVYLAALLPFILGPEIFQQIPRFPAIVRDMALIASADITYQMVQDIISRFPLVERATIFDVYSGEQVSAGKRSLAYRVTYRSPTLTLTDEEVDKIHQQILNELSSKLGITLRG